MLRLFGDWMWKDIWDGTKTHFINWSGKTVKHIHTLKAVIMSIGTVWEQAAGCLVDSKCAKEDSSTYYTRWRHTKRKLSGNACLYIWLFSSCWLQSKPDLWAWEFNETRREQTWKSRFLVNSLQPPKSLRVASIEQLPPIDISTSWLK